MFGKPRSEKCHLVYPVDQYIGVMCQEKYIYSGSHHTSPRKDNDEQLLKMLVNERGKTRFHCFHTSIADQLPQQSEWQRPLSVSDFHGSMHKQVRPTAIHKRIKVELLIVDVFGW
jgi:hypothetical protein